MYFSPMQLPSEVKPVYDKIFLHQEIPIELICAQIIQESSGNSNATRNDSNGGSFGLMQVNRDILPELGFDTNLDLFDPIQNLTVGMTYDLYLYQGRVANSKILKLTGSLRLAMTFLCYNCGVGNFNLLYRNHIAPSQLTTWKDVLSDKSTVSNWQSCLKYPIFIFEKAKSFYNFILED